MKSGNTREFLECIDHQDAGLKYHDRYFFVNGCSCDWDVKTGKILWARIEVYETTDASGRDWIADVCSITRPTVDDCIDAFTHAPLIDGKTFWELENELEWI